MNKPEGLSIEHCIETCYKLLHWVSQTLEKFKRLMTGGRALFSWIAWLLSKFLKGETPEVSRAKQAEFSDQQRARRITALKAWLAQREKEFEEKKICRVCKRVHTKLSTIQASMTTAAANGAVWAGPG